MPPPGGLLRQTVRYIRRDIPQTVGTTKTQRRLSTEDQSILEREEFLFKTPDKNVLGKRKRDSDVNEINKRRKV